MVSKDIQYAPDPKLDVAVIRFTADYRPDQPRQELTFQITILWKWEIRLVSIRVRISDQLWNSNTQYDIITIDGIMIGMVFMRINPRT